MSHFDGEDSDIEEVEYELEAFQIYDYHLEITTVAYLPITTLMVNREQEKEISGQKLWCGSLCIINYLFKHPEYLQQSLIIELGAGTGVLSIIAAKLGGEVIIATDHDQISLNHMMVDFPRNQVNIHVQALNWFEPHLESIREIIKNHPNLQRVLVLAGDVLYKSALLDPFFSTVRALLNLNPSSAASLPSELLLCHIPRADVPQERVQNKLEELSFTSEIISPGLWNYGDLLSTYCPKEDIDRAQMSKIRI